MPTIYKKFLVITATITASFLLSACDTVIPDAYKPASQEDTAYVIVSVGENFVESQAAFGHCSFDFKMKDKQDKGSVKFSVDRVDLEAKHDGLTPKQHNKIKVHVLPLRPGDYEICDIRFYYNNGVSERSYSARTPFSIPFSVEAGKVYYLGEFLGHALQGKDMFGFATPVGGYFVLSDQQERDVAYVKEKAASLNIAIPEDVEVVSVTLDTADNPFIRVEKVE